MSDGACDGSLNAVEAPSRLSGTSLRRARGADVDRESSVNAL